jgi:DNA-binding XRE family transcriptional regulator
MAASPADNPMTPRELKRWRFEMELNQHQAAAALGVAPRTVTAWETGESPIPLAVAYACRWLACACQRRNEVSVTCAGSAGKSPAPMSLERNQ